MHKRFTPHRSVELYHNQDQDQTFDVTHVLFTKAIFQLAGLADDRLINQTDQQKCSKARSNYFKSVPRRNAMQITDFYHNYETFLSE